MANQKLKSAAYHVGSIISNEGKAKIHLLQARETLPKNDLGSRQRVNNLIAQYDQLVEDTKALAAEFDKLAEAEYPKE